jgi:uncharacterized protein with PQ loop repeat
MQTAFFLIISIFLWLIGGYLSDIKQILKEMNEKQKTSK